ncbi:taste receptor type 1 member 3-like [Spea bombifrons]|uniref:taste receptor type 1 member 3-like n=1 Tax=Spea bombifrons TaxID=233779 RepID=UPI00234A055A|nr:taste receptor type 1 member 3-like [Spea bombifrons]
MSCAPGAGSDLRRPKGQLRWVLRLNLQELTGALAMKFAVEEINNSSALLPRTRLGYEIYDSCGTSKVVLQGAVKFLSEGNSSELHVLCNYTSYKTRVTAVIGPSTSELVNPTGKLLSFFHLPQISFEASDENFSDKAKFRSFLRTVPSDTTLAHGITRLLKEFQWNWVAVVGSSDKYGEQGILQFANQASQNGICIAYQGYIPENPNNSAFNGSLQEIILEIQKSNVNVTILISSIYETQLFLSSVIKSKLKMVWVASPSWSLSQTIQQLPGIQDIGTIIGFAVRSKRLQGFEDYVRNILSLIQEERDVLQKSTTPSEDIVQKYFYQIQDLQTRCKECGLLSPTNITKILDPIGENLAYRVYLAVYCIGQALHHLIHGPDMNCSDDASNLLPWQLLDEIKSQSFRLNDDTFNFDSNGNLNIGYDIVTWRNYGKRMFVTVGDFQKKLTLRRLMIDWYTTKIPRSTCSRECAQGQIKITKGFHSCCFDCMTCPEGTFVNSSECSSCPVGEWSKPGSKTCQPPTFYYLTWGDSYVIAILIAMVVVMLLIFAVIVLLIKHLHTPVVSASGHLMSIIGLLGLICMCLSVFFYIGEPTQWMCLLQQPFLSMSFTILLGPILVKSIKLVFPSPPSRTYLHWVLNQGRWTIILSSFLGQVLFCAMYIKASQSFAMKVAAMDVDSLDIYLSCKYEPLLQFGLMFAYNGLLVLLSFICSFMAETPINRYNSARDITFAMLALILAWIIFIPTYVSTAAAYKSLIQIIFILSSCLGILATLFFPKCYIVIFKKELNCNEYFGICDEGDQSEKEM